MSANALRQFCSEKEITPEIELVLHTQSKAGTCRYQWEYLKPVIEEKICRILDDIHSSPHNDVPDDAEFPQRGFVLLKQDLLEALSGFCEAPWTLQRICEILVDYPRYYSRTSKLVNALDKLLHVTMTLPFTPQSEPEENPAPAPAAAPVATSASDTPDADTQAPAPDDPAAPQNAPQDAPPDAAPPQDAGSVMDVVGTSGDT
eukprot:gnl/Trimastix_PCT/1619.p1 GENE.gnl/Trimastix_PCT/1619~~gnl/Trimastix_PCT/1619.p1  ORF type:complete len:203 (+),score=8.56 gnl/Trimastix_PCT/1619:31-639(+)